MNNAIFDSATRSAGDLAGVFEHDDDTGYFYLYDLSRGEGQKIVSAIRVAAGKPAYGAKDVKIRWNEEEAVVGLFIKGQLWAAFECATNQKFGGNFTPDQPPNLPDSILKSFGAT